LRYQVEERLQFAGAEEDDLDEVEEEKGAAEA